MGRSSTIFSVLRPKLWPKLWALGALVVLATFGRLAAAAHPFPPRHGSAAVSTPAAVRGGQGRAASEQRAVSWWYSADNKTEIPLVLEAVKAHPTVFSSMMIYCGYSVGTNGNLTFNGAGYYCDGPDGLVAGLRSLGVATEFVVNTPSGDPLAPFLAAFAAPHPIIDALIAVGKQHGLAGWNLDLEPGSSASGDAAKYQGFLELARPALSAAGLRLTIDVADWSPMLSNYPLLSKAGVRMMDMETYNGDSLDQWLFWYHNIVSTDVPRGDVSIGLGCWVDSSTKGTWAVTPQSGAERMSQIAKDGIMEVSMFRLLPADNWPEPWWWPLLETWASGGNDFEAAIRRW